MNSRRQFLTLLGAGVNSVVLPGARMFAGASAKPLRGIFPIGQTPFTESDKLDLDSLVKQVRFIDRGRVHGLVWPQLASEWSTLTETERLDGAEAIASTGKSLRPAIVIGVQGPDTGAAVRYAKHAVRIGADAIISLPPANQSDSKAVLEYYKQVGAATELPLFVQAVGNMSVDSIIEMYKAIPTLRYVKDEAGEPLTRLAALREKSSDELKVFTGNHGRTMIDEMIRGFSGSMPAASFADIHASAWELWHTGKKRQAVDTFGNAAILINEVGVYGLESMKYILCLRGVFQTYGTREPKGKRLDDTSKRALQEIFDLMKPALRA
jgi:dihydrodipicolinate synthase/N-acetylneuraminate lyase